MTCLSRLCDRSRTEPADLPRASSTGTAYRAAASGSRPRRRDLPTDFATFKAHQYAGLAELAWLYNLNRGIFMTPGREEEWTLSVTHTERAIDEYVAAFEEPASDLTA